MAEDILETFDNKFFRTACHDVLRIVSILSLDSTAVVMPDNKTNRLYEKFIFISRFFYMVFIKGFTPTIFDMLPYTLWMMISIVVYCYRVSILPIILRITGYGKYASWKNIGTMQPSKDDPITKPLPITNSELIVKKKLSDTNFGDEQFEEFLFELHKLTTHLSPHSQSPGNPFASYSGFPGNFFDHLVGVYKMLLAWQQPQYVVRAGLFHSLYGTFDYRFSLFDLKKGREPLSNLIGPASEEIAFAICTSDRIGLIRKLIISMYGSTAGNLIINRTTVTSDTTTKTLPNDETIDTSIEDGNPYPKLIGQLPSEGYPVSNHITQGTHLLSADFFAQFVMVMIADFMEQGAIFLGATDLDVCIFQFLRYRFYADLLQFVQSHLRIIPPVWKKYLMNDKIEFIEAQRYEVIAIKRIWTKLMKQYSTAPATDILLQQFTLQKEELKLIQAMVTKYNYLAEPRIILAATLTTTDALKLPSTFQDLKKKVDHKSFQEIIHTKVSLLESAVTLLTEWGCMTIKEFKLKAVLEVIEIIKQNE